MTGQGSSVQSDTEESSDPMGAAEIARPISASYASGGGMKLATDIGGTFTDLVYLDEASGELGLAKASSTPPGFAQGIMDAVSKSGLDPKAVDHFVHGTTVV